jgi:hypothetical protein
MVSTLTTSGAPVVVRSALDDETYESISTERKILLSWNLSAPV